MALPAAAAAAHSAFVVDVPRSSNPLAAQIPRAARLSEYSAAFVSVTARQQRPAPHGPLLSWHRCRHCLVQASAAIAEAELANTALWAAYASAAVDSADDVAPAAAAAAGLTTEGYLIVNFYHLSDIPEPEQVCLQNPLTSQILCGTLRSTASCLQVDIVVNILDARIPSQSSYHSQLLRTSQRASALLAG